MDEGKFRKSIDEDPGDPVGYRVGGIFLKIDSLLADVPSRIAEIQAGGKSEDEEYDEEMSWDEIRGLLRKIKKELADIPHQLQLLIIEGRREKTLENLVSLFTKELAKAERNLPQIREEQGYSMPNASYAIEHFDPEANGFDLVAKRYKAALYRDAIQKTQNLLEVDKEIQALKNNGTLDSTVQQWKKELEEKVKTAEEAKGGFGDIDRRMGAFKKIAFLHDRILVGEEELGLKPDWDWARKKLIEDQGRSFSLESFIVEYK